MTASRLRIGVIGLGVGRFHANAFATLPGVEVVALASRSDRRLGVSLDAFADHHSAKVYVDGMDLLEREELDAVSICTPPTEHRGLVEAAAARGVHILLEKPMAASLADCDAMIRACDQAAVALCLNFPMRHLAAVREAKTLLEDTEIGPPFLVAAEYVMGPRPKNHWVWEMGPGSGPIVENTCHTVDLLRYLVGDIATVSAEAGNFLGPGYPVEDCAVIALRFASGAIGTITGGAVGTDASEIRPRLSMYMAGGQLVVDGTYHTYHRTAWALRDGSRGGTDHGAPRSLPSALGPFDTYSLLDPSLRSFVDDIRAGRPASVTGRDGRAALEVTLAVSKAAATRRSIEAADPVVANLERGDA